MDDALSLTFDLGEALEEPLQLLGAPVVTLRLAIDRPLGESHPTHSSTAAHYIFVHRGWGTEGVLIGITLLPSGPTGMIAVRLNEVRPDGASARVTFGLLNLAHRGGDSAHPVPMQPGRVEVVTLRLNDAAYTFGVGCRLRLAISTRCNLYSPTCRLGGRANCLTSSPHTYTALVEVSISTPPADIAACCCCGV